MTVVGKDGVGYILAEKSHWWLLVEPRDCILPLDNKLMLDKGQERDVALPVGHESLQMTPLHILFSTEYFLFSILRCPTVSHTALPIRQIDAHANPVHPTRQSPAGHHLPGPGVPDPCAALDLE